MASALVQVSKQVVALEEAVVAVAGVGDHQRLHRQRVLLHQVGDAGIGVDHDLVGQAHLAAAVGLLGRDELLAEGPVVVVDRHADRGVGVDHLLGGDHLDLVGVGVQAVHSPWAMRAISWSKRSSSGKLHSEVSRDESVGSCFLSLEQLPEHGVDVRRPRRSAAWRNGDAAPSLPGRRTKGSGVGAA